MKVGVKIMPREVVLDTQGRAVEKVLKQHGREVLSCRVGRYVTLDLKEETKEEALTRAADLAEFALHNPLIEQYELEVL